MCWWLATLRTQVWTHYLSTWVRVVDFVGSLVSLTRRANPQIDTTRYESSVLILGSSYANMATLQILQSLSALVTCSKLCAVSHLQAFCNRLGLSPKSIRGFWPALIGYVKRPVDSMKTLFTISRPKPTFFLCRSSFSGLFALSCQSSRTCRIALLLLMNSL